MRAIPMGIGAVQLNRPEFVPWSVKASTGVILFVKLWVSELDATPKIKCETTLVPLAL